MARLLFLQPRDRVCFSKTSIFKIPWKEQEIFCQLVALVSLGEIETFCGEILLDKRRDNKDVRFLGGPALNCLCWNHLGGFNSVVSSVLPQM